MSKEGVGLVGWFPLRGSWEESVLSWHEQVETALRNRKGNGLRARRVGATRAAAVKNKEPVTAVEGS